MSDYLKFLNGNPVQFEIAARTSPQQVAERLRSKVRSRLWPFHFEKIVGRVGAETLSIEWRGSALRSNMAPRLSGRLVSSGSGTRFEGRFGAPFFLRFFLIAWVCFDLIFGVGMVNSRSGPDGAPWFLFPFLLVHLFFPFGIAALGMIGADRIQQRLTDFVVETGSRQA